MSSATLEGLPAGDDRDAEISRDAAFELLSCRRRRYVIHYLKRHDGAVDLRELVSHVAAWENGVTASEVTYDQRTRVYTALRQSHLPKLDDGGAVDFDPDRGTVELTEAAATLEVYLDVVPHDDIPWSKYYAGLGALTTGFVCGMWVGAVPFSFVPPLVGALIVTALFTISAAYHVRHDRRMRLGGENRPPEMEVDE